MIITLLIVIVVLLFLVAVKLDVVYKSSRCQAIEITILAEKLGISREEIEKELQQQQ